MSEPLLDVRDLRTAFPMGGGRKAYAVDGVSFSVGRREIVGIVGESGSGKSVTARSIIRLVPEPGRIVGGEIVLKGTDLLDLRESEMRKIRGSRIAMIPQDPMTSLNPVLRVGSQISEAITTHRDVQRSDAKQRAVSLLGQVHVPSAKERAEDYPHQFSGGMRQRSVIAMGLANEPELLVADEPTTALDVTIQAQICDLLRELNDTHGTSIILITHDMALIASMCDRVIVMYAGQVVEEGPTKDIFRAPRHPYTWSLLKAVPRPDRASRESLYAIEGAPPILGRFPEGCRFHPRCPRAAPECLNMPNLTESTPTGRFRCWIPMDTEKGERNG